MIPASSRINKVNDFQAGHPGDVKWVKLLCGREFSLLCDGTPVIQKQIQFCHYPITSTSFNTKSKPQMCLFVGLVFSFRWHSAGPQRVIDSRYAERSPHIQPASTVCQQDFTDSKPGMGALFFILYKSPHLSHFVHTHTHTHTHIHTCTHTQYCHPLHINE